MNRLPFASALLTAFVSLGVGASAAAQKPTPLPLPEDLKAQLATEVGVDELLGAQVPLDLSFHTPAGESVTLAELFPGDGQPVVLSFSYADCPSLCESQLDGLAIAMSEVQGWTLGDNYRVVSLCLDPAETAERTLEVRDRMASMYTPLASSPETWNFLNGSAEDVRAVADAVGFRFSYDEDTAQYLHVPALILLTPDGRVARYLYGLRHPAQNFRLALAETADGSLRSTADRILLYCFAFDPTANSYVLAAWNLTRIFLAAFALALFAFLLRLFRQGRRPSATAEA